MVRDTHIYEAGSTAIICHGKFITVVLVRLFTVYFWMTWWVAAFSFSSLKMLISHLGLSAQYISLREILIGGVQYRLTIQGDVEAQGSLAQLVQRRNGVGVKLNLLEVLADARGRDRLGDDGVAADLRPGEDDLRGRHGLALGGGQALGDGLDLGRGDQQRQAQRVVAKGRVGREHDALLGEVLDQRQVGQARVALDLVDGGDDARLGDDGLELRWEFSMGGLRLVGGQRLTCSMEKLETPIERALVLGSLVTAMKLVRILAVEQKTVEARTLPGGTDGNTTVQLDNGALGGGRG